MSERGEGGGGHTRGSASDVYFFDISPDLPSFSFSLTETQTL